MPAETEKQTRITELSTSSHSLAYRLPLPLSLPSNLPLSAPRLSIPFSLHFLPSLALSPVYDDAGGGAIGMCACVHVFMQVCVCNGCWGGGGVGLLGLCSADVIIRNWNSGNSWEGWTVLEGFSSAAAAQPPLSRWPYGKIQHVPTHTITAINYP